MLYKKKTEPVLTNELFKNPTSEFRGAPFWAWNCKLDKDELLRQIDVLKEMGFGGAHMHVRTGMATPYLSDEFMDLIRACVDKMKAEEMHAYLYDEDRWPSGAAGGIVTKDPAYRARYLLFTPVPYGANGEKQNTIDSRAVGGRAENGTFVSAYDVELDPAGRLISYRQIGEDETAEHEKWYAYLELTQESPWYNNQTYVNTLDKKAMDRFIEVTYEAYKNSVGDEFDETVPSIFTDEPQFTRKTVLRYATDKTDVTLPWTDDLPETYKAIYNEDLVAGIPELFWDNCDGTPSVIRYHYHDHICERFTNAFADNCGAWCRANNLKLTGHMMEEPTLESQTAALGEAMRAYRGFDLPGIDMLCAWLEYTTAKQTQSAVHQFGCEGMTSELYGVTNWDFDFRGHKLHGDWQAALGVTLRVQHLAWVSMAGEAKRDYPASISYQSPWWKEYRRVEDHFARVNTAMTRGKAVVKVGMIHPVESYWLHWGPAESTSLEREELDRNFQETAKNLLLGSVDFDYISESLLPGLCPEASAPLRVGQMAYDTIIVPGCETLRSTTLERLEKFRAAGGKLIFAGAVPTLENAVKSDRAKKLAEQSVCIPLSRGSLLNALQEDRLVEIRDERGALTENMLYQLRQDGDSRWLFIAHAKESYNKDVSYHHDIRIRLKGLWNATLYDTLTGEITEVSRKAENGHTDIFRTVYDYDSILLKLEPAEEYSALIPAEEKKNVKNVEVPVRVTYTLSERNAVLLDQAEWALNDGEWQPKEEILRLDNECRLFKGWPGRGEAVAQPWVIPETTPEDVIRLRYTVLSDIDTGAVEIALEDAEDVKITVNGTEVPSVVTGYYTDKSIKTVAIPAMKKGENTIELVIPFGPRTSTEWAYLLGDFGVAVHGREARIIERPETLTFGDITSQGFPFYGGNVTYHVPVETEGGEIIVRSGRYRGVLQTVTMDGREENLIYPPYTASLGAPEKGTHMLDFMLGGHRRNGFGPVHLCNLAVSWVGPSAWRSKGDEWNYDYCICEEGILSTPVITESVE